MVRDGFVSDSKPVNNDFLVADGRGI